MCPKSLISEPGVKVAAELVGLSGLLYIFIFQFYLFFDDDNNINFIKNLWTYL